MLVYKNNIWETRAEFSPKNPPAPLYSASVWSNSISWQTACLANLPQCLHINLTSWQAYWSASKMTWLATGSILVFGRTNPEVPFNWVTCPCLSQSSPKKRQSSLSDLVSRYILMNEMKTMMKDWQRGRALSAWVCSECAVSLSLTTVSNVCRFRKKILTLCPLSARTG